MRIGNNFPAMFLAALLAYVFPTFHADAAESGGGVAIRYHFAGAANLAGNTNFEEAGRIFSLPPARRFQGFVLDRLAGIYWNALQFDPGGKPALLRPLLDDLLQTESAGCFGGRDKERMDFVIAARLDGRKAQGWEKNLETVLHGQGRAVTVDGYSGRLWERPDNHSFWMIRAGDWTIAGRGDDLAGVRAEYLQNIKKNSQPAPMGRDTWLSAAVDWPLLATWVPLSGCPFKLGRTVVDVTAGSGRLRATACVYYPEAAAWRHEPWRIPKGLVSSPLSSFTAGRDLAAYMNPDRTMSRLSCNPLTNQLYCWALREMALESYAACPVADATHALRQLGLEAPGILNSYFQARDHTQLTWQPGDNKISLAGLPLTAPVLEADRDNSGDFLVAKVFPLKSGHVPAPDQLWGQIEGRDNLVYYDWEITWMRLLQWRLLTELLPVLPAPTPADAARQQQAAQDARGFPTPLVITESWLAELSVPMLGNTVTEAVWTSPTKLTVTRNSQFLFTGLELVALSHWLADAPIGPVDYGLLPVAPMSGPLLQSLH